MLKIKFDAARCTGHARCAAKGPDVYEIDEDGYFQSADRIVAAEWEQQARAGAKACPEEAIDLIETDDGTLSPED